MATAKVFMSGRSQAVRLPKEYRFACDEVEVTREGDGLVLRPIRGRAWVNLLAATNGFDESRFADLFPQGREQPHEQTRADLDDVLA